MYLDLPKSTQAMKEWMAEHQEEGWKDWMMRAWRWMLKDKAMDGEDNIVDE